MSGPRFPAELFDHIVDLLQDSRDALKSCCLTSKSWIPSTRKHLFAEVEFDDAEDVESWKIAFPNPSTSPAVYTKALYVGSFCAVLATDAEEGGWMSSFSQVVHLEISTDEHANFNFTLLHGFSPVLKSLNVTFFKFQSSQIFDLICSFPLLEDLFVSMRLRNPTDLDNHSFNEQSTITKLSTSPPFTGCLELGPAVGIEPIASRLLSLPGSLCFRQLSLALRFEADALIIGALVEECCFTLEYLDVFDGGGPDLPESAQINLSKATKLKHVELTFGLRPRLLIKTLRTVTRDHTELKQISLAVISAKGLYNREDVRSGVGEVAYQL